MWILMLEAGMALFLLIFIVWWTMFSGRKPEEQHQKDNTHIETDTKTKD
jgi:Ca2+/Na+ antiporter